MASTSNPQVYFDISIGKQPLGRVTMELFAEVLPKTAENFRCLCTGERGTSPSGNKLHYKGSTFHRIISGFMAQGGDFTAGDGTGGESIYGAKFADESFYFNHSSAGLLSMANSGPHTNGSQFFITFRDTPHLDGRHVVFGKVISGMDLLKELEHVPTINDRPKHPVVISDCGQVTLSTGSSSTPTETQVETAEPEPEEEEEIEEEETIDEAAYNNMTETEKRLFNIRLKINKGRKANKAAAVDEYKRFTDPKYAKKQTSEPRETKPKSSEPAYMFDTAEKSEYLQEKQRKKESNKATFGWQAFTTDAQYKSYKKQLNKLPTSSSIAGTEQVSESSELQYGKQGTEVSSHALNRLAKNIEDREKQRETFSRRRAHIDATSVDAINEKNEHFNKKLKRTYDKYTVEIRQNLERGTAL